MYSTINLMRWAKVAVPLLGVLGSCVFPAVQAAEPQPGTLAVQDSAQTLGLKFDLGLALEGDDCEEDYTDLLVASPEAPSSAPAQPAAQKTDAMLAKLAPVENFHVGRSMPAKQVVPALDVRTAQAPAIPQAVPIAAPAAPVVPVAAAATAAAWEIIPADKTLNTAMARWAAEAGWQLVWELPVDYAVEARTTINGSFEEAVGLVVQSMETAEIPMKAIFYEGNKVLRVVAKGAQ